MTEAVKVIVRARPFITKEINMGCKSCLIVDEKERTITIKKPDEQFGSKSFKYDEVLGEASTQQKAYDDSTFSVVESAMEGYNGTVFAYGQTGAGKTFTMMGVNYEDSSSYQKRGLIPRTL